MSKESKSEKTTSQASKQGQKNPGASAAGSSERESDVVAAEREDSDALEAEDRESVADEDEDLEQSDEGSAGSSRKRQPTRAADAPNELDERKINAPDRQTLGMLATIAVVTLVLWGAGRAACNLHPPRETRRPREVKLEELARTPKDAALELALRWGKKDYEGALELAEGAVAQRLERAKKECEKKADVCKQQQQALSDKVLGVATQLSRSPSSAIVRVSTVGTDTPESAYRLNMQRQGRIWKAFTLLPGPGSDPKPEPKAKPDQDAGVAAKGQGDGDTKAATAPGTVSD